MYLSKNEIITLDENEKMEVVSLLGSGGQGEVYLVKINDKEFALKVYIETPSDEFVENLRNNISRGEPCSTFIWPKQLITFDDGHVGYLMDLRPNNYKSFISYLNGKEVFKNQATLIRWCIELCASFKKLHEFGFSYQDLNDGSFFLDPDTGDLLICDNDNVTANKCNLGVLGKMRYMAPEIVRGEQEPDIHSDRFSLAVILFMALCVGNPYEGERLKEYDIIDDEAEMELFGTNPIFVYHKTNKTNRPIRGYHTSLIKRWPLIPIYIKEAFHRCFVDGLVNRENERTTEIEWIKLLSKYRDELTTCTCGREYKYGLEENHPVEACPFCKNKKPLRLSLDINKYHIVLEPGKEIYRVHLDKYSTAYNEKIGEVVRSKNNPNIWGIKLEHNGVTLEDSYQNSKSIEENKVIPIIQDTTIIFNENLKATIKLIETKEKENGR